MRKFSSIRLVGKYTIFPLGKVAMYAFNLLEYVDYYLSEKPDITVLVPEHFYSNDRPIANRYLLSLIVRSFEKHNIPYTKNRVLIGAIYLLQKLQIINIHRKSEANDAQEFYDQGFQVSIMPQYATRSSAYNREEKFCDLIEDDRNKGYQILEKNAVDTTKTIVTVHVRDNKYGATIKESNYGLNGGHTFRNSKVETVITSTFDYLKDNNINLFRMGADQLPVNDTRCSGKFIDYTNNFRSDFMDIFLISESKFFIGTCSGLHGIAYLFKVPILGLNFIPIFDATLSNRDLWMPKKIWIKNEKKFMKFSDMFSMNLMHGSINDNYLISNNLEVVDNSDEDIFNAVAEMNSLVDSNLEITDKDDWLWNKFKAIVLEKCNDSHVIRNSKSRISPHFLMRNEDLL